MQGQIFPYGIVTAADSGYFDLACDLIDSVRRGDKSIPFGVLDVGLSPDQIDVLKFNEVIVVPAAWEFSCEIPAGLRRTYLAMLSRPFLPKYFPCFDIIVYLDADTWVQIPSSIDDLIEAANGVDAVVAPEIHVAFPHLYSPVSLIRNMHRAAYTEAFGSEPPPPADGAVLNSGVVVARRESALWPAWQQALAKQVRNRVNVSSMDAKAPLTLKSDTNHFLEQNALNYAFYKKQFGIRPVSPLYNWVCTLGMPFFDPQTGLLTEPVAPFSPIRIVHLTQAGRTTTMLKDRKGGCHEKRLRWGDFSLNHQ